MTTRRADPENVEATRLLTPSRELTTSAEVARLVFTLLFEPGNINMQDIAINGGRSLNK